MLLWAHAFGLAVFALLRGYGLWHSLLETGSIAAAALIAASTRFRRRVRTGAASVGLITSSALLVHFSGGYIEMHFHFFVMVAVVALYQDWIPFLIAFGYVALHHGVVGVLDPDSVYNHPDAIAHPWRWAMIHAGFILGESAACLITWRQNEIARADVEMSNAKLSEALVQLDHAQEIAQTGSWEWNIITNDVTWSDQLYRIFGTPVEGFEPSFAAWLERVHPADRDRTLAAVHSAVSNKTGFRFDHQILRGDEVRVVRSRGEVLLDKQGNATSMVGTAQDITKEHQVEQRLVSALEKERESVARLRELDQAKSSFVSSVSHELRTPLTSIMGYMDMLMTDPGTMDGEQLGMMKIVERNSSRLLALIEDLLTLSRIESGQFTVNKAPVPLNALVDQIKQTVMPAIERRELVLEVDVPGDLPPLDADREQIERVLFNLIGNAVKFSYPGGGIGIRARFDDGKVGIEVWDQGMGIPEEEQEQVFSRFFRSSSAEKQAIQGTGLGLAICKEIVEQHGGSIRASSAPGRGTTVSFTIPAVAESDPDQVRIKPQARAIFTTSTYE
ncbi:MAG: ATP-binding protein [Actinomycetota bacterium]